MTSTSKVPALGYAFNNPDLLALALTHPSCAKQKSGMPLNNQRLEFLGDAVLGLVVAELLYEMYPHEQEGELARRFAALVCGERLVAVAKELELGAALTLSKSEAEAGGRDNASNLEDACEAVIGAMYLDGGLEAARPFVLRFWRGLAQSYAAPPKDAKTALQEWAQGRGLPLPEYVVVSETGSAHAPQFTIEVRVQGQNPTQATANAKRVAERLAAEKMLEEIGG